jgi:hypothetical protein
VRALAPVLLVALAAAGSGPSSASRAAVGCPGLASASALPARHDLGVLHGDVDGDGHPDVVKIREARRAPAACHFVLVVVTAHGALAARLDAYENPAPKLAVLAAVDPHRLAIAVEVMHGASTGTAAVFVVDGQTLRHVVNPGWSGRDFLYNGSVTHFGGVSCYPQPRSGRFVVGGYGPPTAHGKIAVDRAFYRLDGATLHLVRSTHASLTRSQLYARNYPEFRTTALFPTCTVARTRLDW